MATLVARINSRHALIDFVEPFGVPLLFNNKGGFKKYLCATKGAFINKV
jgi:hypothetical protein